MALFSMMWKVILELSESRPGAILWSFGDGEAAFSLILPNHQRTFLVFVILLLRPRVGFPLVVELLLMRVIV